MNEELRDEVARVLADKLAYLIRPEWVHATASDFADALAPLLDRLTQERDRAREQVARVEALCDNYHVRTYSFPDQLPQWADIEADLRRILEERP